MLWQGGGNGDFETGLVLSFPEMSERETKCHVAGCVLRCGAGVEMGQKLQWRLSGSLLKLSPTARLIPLELRFPEARVLLSCRCESAWKRGGLHPAVGMSLLLLTK